jgi:DNA-damage-inducible protein J
MPASDFVRARIDPAIKDEAAKVLAAMGLTVSDVCRMALTRVAYERRLPFTDPEPNELTRETIEKAERGEDVFYAKDFDDLMRQLRS